MLIDSYEKIGKFIESKRSIYKALLLNICKSMNQIKNYLLQQKMNLSKKTSDLYCVYINPLVFPGLFGTL